ncbi:MAG TPA: hypothetical protein LFW13_00560 [Rickettsia endosymbiont of Sericostoma sp.]|nr:hypothetical protein [Rickettsia endosymbiont of Sericostoma sp.]
MIRDFDNINNMQQQTHIVEKSLQQRVINAAQQMLSCQDYVSPIDIMINIGWLQPIHVKNWRQGKEPFLEKVIQVNLNKLILALQYLEQWALDKGLKPSETVYMSHNTKSKIRLRFSKSGQSTIERKYSTHYISPMLSENKIAKLRNKWEKSPDLVVFCLINDAECSKCHKELFKGSLLFKNGDDAECIDCCELNDLVFLPSGDAKLTRYAKNYSSKKAVVVKFSRVRKRYERQGIMIEKEALRKAKRELEGINV